MFALVEVREELVGFSPFLLSCGFRGENLDLQTRWGAPLLFESLSRPMPFFEDMFVKVITLYFHVRNNTKVN